MISTKKAANRQPFLLKNQKLLIYSNPGWRCTTSGYYFNKIHAVCHVTEGNNSILAFQH